MQKCLHVGHMLFKFFLCHVFGLRKDLHPPAHTLPLVRAPMPRENGLDRVRDIGRNQFMVLVVVQSILPVCLLDAADFQDVTVKCLLPVHLGCEKDVALAHPPIGAVNRPMILNGMKVWTNRHFGDNLSTGV